MADQETQNVEETETEQEEKVEEKPQEEMFTKDQVNEIVKSRLAKERKKYEGFDDLKEKADKYDKEAQKSLGLEQELEEARNEIKAHEKRQEIINLKNKVGKETGINPNILRGTTEDEIKQHAEEIKSVYAYPQVEQGKNPNGESYKQSPTASLEKGLARGNIFG